MYCIGQVVVCGGLPHSWPEGPQQALGSTTTITDSLSYSKACLQDAFNSRSGLLLTVLARIPDTEKFLAIM
jgi:hypothetical protein